MDKLRDSRTWLILIILVLGFSLPPPLAAEPTKKRHYPLPGAGTLELEVPSSWEENVSQDKKGYQIIYGGRNFFVSISSHWYRTPSGEWRSVSIEITRSVVERMVKEITPEAVERSLPIIEFSGVTGKGYYYSATYKYPSPGQGKYLTQGTIAVGSLLCSFTIFTPDKNSPVVQEVLNMMRTAIHKK